MAKKATGLAAFTRPKAGGENKGADLDEGDRPSIEMPAPRRKRGGGETVRGLWSRWRTWRRFVLIHAASEFVHCQLATHGRTTRAIGTHKALLQSFQ